MPRRPGPLRRLGRQLVHFFALMLWAAGTLAFLAGLPQLGVAIFAIVVLNAVFAFAQEGRADRASDRLRALLPMKVTVRRDGSDVLVDATVVVRGDLLVLGEGDRVPADATLVVSDGLRVDTSMLTGESRAQSFEVGDLLVGGTFVVEGQAEAEVTATGSHTRLAEISRLTVSGVAPASPLTIELRRVVRVISVIALSLGAAFAVVALSLGTSLSDGLVFGIGVTVALVPEGLLPTVTLSLAWGAEQMSHRQILVRELSSVETLGSTTFICTDKTGTLTRNEMAVVEAWTPAGGAAVTGEGYEPTGSLVGDDGALEAVSALALVAARCSTGRAVRSEGGWHPRGDPMEAALDVFARRAGHDTDADRARRPVSERHPFDPRRRRMSVVVDGQLLVKGAPDTVLPLCTSGVDPVPGRSADGVDPRSASEVLDRMEAKGLRVLAVARRRFGPGEPPSGTEGERDLELLGLVGLHDPPRPDVVPAIEACRRAGVKVAMVTGDHPGTATAIADEVGLRRPTDPVLVGRDLPDDDDDLAALVDHDGVVIARVAPEEKLRIARALRGRGHVLAMTGDGVNDAPALHEADIGVAMGRSGTDVAREAADLVLLDDHFGTIVAAIEQGRATFVNIRRFLTYHLSDNVAELSPFLVWALSGGRFPLALGVLQVLALDLGTDTVSAVALGAEPPARHLLEGPPVRGRLLNRTVARRAFGLLGPIEAVGALAAFLVSFVAVGWRPGETFPTGDVLAAASGAAFMAVVFGQTANAFACRSSTRWPGSLGWTTNRLLLPAVGVGLAVSTLLLVVPPLADALGQLPPPLAGWAAALSVPAVLLGADAADKRRRRRVGSAGLDPREARSRVG